MRGSNHALLLVVVLPLVGCDSAIDPSGSYKEPARLSYLPREPGVPTPNSEEFDDVKITKEGGDRYRVSFGSCSVMVARQKHSDGTMLPLAKGGPCPTKHGDASIDAGYVSVHETQPLQFAFSGWTGDTKFKVQWLFLGSVK